jgi:hypothetical protein
MAAGLARRAILKQKIKYLKECLVYFHEVGKSPQLRKRARTLNNTIAKRGRFFAALRRACRLLQVIAHLKQ